MADYPQKQKSSSKNQTPSINMEIGHPVINILFMQREHTSIACDLHWHQSLEFFYVKKGGVLLLNRGERTWIYPGEIGFVNWCQIHGGIEFLDHTEHYIIQIGPSFFQDELIQLPAPFPPQRYLSLLLTYSQQLPVSIANQNKLSQDLDEIIQLYQHKTIAYQLKLKACAYHFMANLAEYFFSDNSNIITQNPKESDDLGTLDLVKKILLFLSSNYMKFEEVSLSSLSSMFGLSVPYLCKIFKQYTGITIVSYLQRIRCERAAALIQSGVALENAAHAVGFQDYNYFSRVFKKTTGSSPSAKK